MTQQEQIDDDFELPLPDPQELPLPYFVDGDILGIVGQNKIFRYVWMFLMGGPAAALMSNMRFGRISIIPTAATTVACLIVLAISWVSMSGGYTPGRSAPMLFNRKKRELFFGYYDEGLGKMIYKNAPFEALTFEDAFGGFGSATLNIKIAGEDGAEIQLNKFSRLIDRKESGSLSYLVEKFMAGHDVIKPSAKCAAQYAAELKKRPALPPEAQAFLSE